MGNCASEPDETKEPVKKVPKASKTKDGSEKDDNKAPEAPANPPWHGLNFTPVATDDRQAAYDKLFAEKGAAKNTHESGGTTQKTFENGVTTQESASMIAAVFKDGTQYQYKKVENQIFHIYKDGKNIEQWMRFENGTVQETINDEDGETQVQTSPDGTKITSLPDGSKISECRPDMPGGVIEQKPDGTTIQTYGKEDPNASTIDTLTIYTSGTKAQVFRDGSYVTWHPLDEPPPDGHPMKWSEVDDPAGFQENSYPTWGPHARELPQWAKDELARRKAEEEAAAAAKDAAREAAEAKKQAELEAERQRIAYEQHMKELADAEEKQKAEEARRKELEAEKERLRKIEEEEAARLAKEKAALDAEEAKRKRREEAEAWFYSLNYMQIKKWLKNNNVSHEDIMGCLGIYELRQLAIHTFGENFTLTMTH